MEGKKRKFLLIYLKTGSGHLAPAKSIASKLVSNYTDIEPLLVDGFEKAPALLKAVIEDGYRNLQSKAKWFYELLYAVYKIKIISQISAWFISVFIRKHLTALLLSEKPDKIIIFHFFLIRPVYSAVSDSGLEIPIATVVTDPFIAHRLWFLNKKQNLIVFSNQLKNHCISMGFSENQIRVFPFILDEKFSAAVPAEEKLKLKSKYLVQGGKEVLLILGGGDGIPKGKKILTRILKNFNETEILLVCGKNKSLYNKALQIREQGNYKNLHVYGYVNFVYDLINISDIVITKCGASTFMEIIISKKIPVITSYIWEQEKGNKDYIVQNGMGVYVRNLNLLPGVIEAVLLNRSFYEQNIEKAGLKNGADEVAGFIAT